MATAEDLLARTDGMFYSSPPLRFDPVIGYRWRTGTTRLLSLCKGELIFDSHVRFNNWGHHCSYDYVPRKRSPEVFRFIVLGDSFTNGMAMQRTWPETLQELLRARPEHGRQVEVYALPVDGGGILNWHQVFIRQILPNFDFDALILGDTVNDGGNKFITAHSNARGAYVGFHDYDQRPRKRADFQRSFRQMRRYYDIIPEPVLEEMARRARARGPLPPVKPAAYLQIDEAPLLAPRRAGSAKADAALTGWYGERRLGMLREMVEACRARGAAVIYYAMPQRRELLLLKKRRQPLLQQARAEALTRLLQVDYFDGYGAFAGATPREVVDLCWLKYDGHWALPGANLFAASLAAWIVRQGVVKPTASKA